MLVVAGPSAVEDALDHLARRYKAMAENIAHFARGEALANVVWCDGHAVGQP